MDKQIKEAFNQVQAEEKLKQYTKHIMHAELTSKNQKNIKKDTTIVPKRFSWGSAARYVTVAVLLAVFIVIGIFNPSVDAQASYIRLEGEISVGLSLDNQDKVIAVQGLNEQGEELLKGMNLKGMTYRKAVDCIMESKLRQTGRPPSTGSTQASFNDSPPQKKMEVPIVKLH